MPEQIRKGQGGNGFFKEILGEKSGEKGGGGKKKKKSKEQGTIWGTKRAFPAFLGGTTKNPKHWKRRGKCRGGGFSPDGKKEIRD